MIDVKGRIACELSSADELLLTEMMFNGVFNDLTPGSFLIYIQGWYAEFWLNIDLGLLPRKTTARLSYKIDLLTLHTYPALGSTSLFSSRFKPL